MKPFATSPLSMVSAPNAITNIPADLKNTLENFPLPNFTDVKLMRDKTGSVPSAKKVIVRAPVTKLPVDRLYICID